MDTSNFFNEDLHPKEFDISFEEVNEKYFLSNVNLFACYPVERQMGKRINMVVKNHGKIVGFIRFSSPVLSIKPRNNYFGNKLKAGDVNPYMLNGSVIVCVQPFGYNFNGGKLLTYLCISNEMTEIIRKILPEYCFFETTSLRGENKQSSQYDGMEPYLRKNGLTSSRQLSFPTNDIYEELRHCIEPVYGEAEFGGRVVDLKKSSPKLREYTKLISFFEDNLKEMDIKKYDDFMELKNDKLKIHCLKGYYYSTLGYSNVREHIIFNEPLIEKERYKFDFKYLYEKWLKQSINRYERLKSEDLFRTELGLQIF